jgi:hypothetical protein
LLAVVVVEVALEVVAVLVDFFIKLIRQLPQQLTQLLLVAVERKIQMEVILFFKV